MEKCKQSLLDVFVNEPAQWEICRIQTVLKGVLSALVYLHSRSYVHRDIKLSNLLVKNDNCVQICDFGCASKMGHPVSSVCGTVSYMPPELIKRDIKYVQSCVDVWSFGCCAFMLMMGHQPFKQHNHEETMLRIQLGLYAQSVEVLAKRNAARLNELLSRMFALDYKLRISSAELLCDPFFASDFTNVTNEITVKSNYSLVA